MKHQTNHPSSSNGSRCRHYTVNGRQCRLRVLDTRSGLCFRHASPPPAQSDSEDLSPELLPQLSEFESAADVKQFLARLLVLVTKGRVTPRRAAVMAYTCNLLLRTLPAIDRELNPQDDEPQQIIFDMPRPERDWPTPEPEPKIFSGIPGVTPMPEKKLP
jgi:hypothetical protein